MSAYHICREWYNDSLPMMAKAYENSLIALSNDTALNTKVQRLKPSTKSHRLLVLPKFPGSCAIIAE